MTIEIKCSYTELRDIETIVPNPRNPNTHPAEQIKRLAKIIEHTGFRSPIVISKRSGFVIKGHGRLMAAKALQMDAVPVDIQDYTDEAQEWSDMIADNRIAELSEIDNTMLTELLNELPEIDFTGFNDDEINALITHIEPEQQETTGDDDVLVSVPNRTVLGDIYQLGNHRLMCGDSADFSNVETLMDGKKFNLLVTDPPYGINYSLDQTGRCRFDNRKPGKIEYEIENDNVDLEPFLTSVFENIEINASDNWGGFIFYSDSKTLENILALNKCRIKIGQHLIWKKNNHTLSFFKYQYIHEPILFVGPNSNVKPNGNWYGGHQETVLEFSKDAKTKHPNQKPVELIENLISNTTKSSDIVLDFFGGSGSTLIACEKTNRINYSMELSPKYCDVIVNRYVNFCKENNREWSVILNGNDITNEFQTNPSS